MKSLTESIQMVNEGQLIWQVIDHMRGTKTIDRFKAPDAPFLWINPSNEIMSFVTFDAIQSAFEDDGSPEDSDEVKKLQIGDSYSPDGINIYIRIKK